MAYDEPMHPEVAELLGRLQGDLDALEGLLAWLHSRPTYFVAPDGSAENSGLDREHPWSLDRAGYVVDGTPERGSTVRIRAGHYSGEALALRPSVESVEYIACWPDEDGAVVVDGLSEPPNPSP